MLALAHSIMTLMMKLGQNKSYTHTQINKGKALFFCDLSFGNNLTTNPTAGH